MTTENMPAAPVGTPAKASPPHLHGAADGPVPRISAFQQWWVLTVRGLTKVFRNGEFIFAFVSPALLAVCFYFPLRDLVDNIGYDYAQFLMPIIMLQSVAFVSSAAAMRAALDGREGVHERFRVLPMRLAIPMLARTATNAVLLMEALACGLVACLLLGWRPDYDAGAGLQGTVVVVALAGLVGVLLALVADGIGLVAGSPEATSQLIAFPTLILGMLSTGFIPLMAFPGWIQGFVRNQPISQITTAMRKAENGTLTWSALAPTLYWCVALAVLAGVLLAVHMRRSAR